MRPDGFSLALLATVVFAPLPFSVAQPGLTADVLGENQGKEVITVSGAPAHDTSGQLRMTTIEATGPDASIRLGDVLSSWFDTDRAVMPRDAVYPNGDDVGEIDALCIPVGNAGNVTAYWKGFTERGSQPRMLGFQAAGAAPLVHGAPVEAPETVASAIRIGNPARWEEAMDAFASSRGDVRAVTDEQILDAYRFLASEEGVFCEPASDAGVAGLLEHGAEGADRIACVLTGHGLKDPDTALLAAPAPTVVPIDPGAVADALELR